MLLLIYLHFLTYLDIFINPPLGSTFHMIFVYQTAFIT